MALPPISNLTEHQTHRLPADHGLDLAGLQAYLTQVWQNRRWEQTTTDPSAGPPLLQIGYDARRQPYLKAGKYVGFIQYGGQTIQLVPKLFDHTSAGVAFQHMLWWLSYCQRIQFPFTDLSSDQGPVDDFPEALLLHFARHAHRLVSEQPYHQYEAATAAMTTLRGRLNTAQYITHSLSQGNWQHLICDYEPFVFNNRLNQIIKYVARLLSRVCRTQPTHRHLEQLLFVLDEVEDLPATADCEALPLNRFFAAYGQCLDMCRFFLSDSYLSQPDDRHAHFCLLLPTDYLFEDFIFGVAKACLVGGVHIKQQSTWLTRERVFQLRSDMLLIYPGGRRLIVDTKYKVRADAPGLKAGVAQTDIYQMIAYALRQTATEVVLLYPQRADQVEAGASAAASLFHVDSALLDGASIQIRACDVPITGSTKQAMIATLRAHLVAIFQANLL